MIKYQGVCSCGEVKVALHSDLRPEEFQPRSDAQTCHFCQEHKGIWISDAKGFVDIDPSNVTSIKTFASRQVKFHFCVKCKDLTYALYSDSAGVKEVAVVRRDLFEAIAPFAKPVMITDFDGEAQDVGQKRRLANWTPVRPNKG